MGSSSLSPRVSSTQEASASLTPQVVPQKAEASSCPTRPPLAFISERQKREAKKLFFEFLSRYFGVEVIGIQPGFGHGPDSYLFQGPFGTTMCVPTDIMLERDETKVRQIIQEKITRKKQEFERTKLEGEGSKTGALEAATF